MKQLNNYINEKLHLKKGVKHCHRELNHFIVVYSSRGEDKFKFFDKYDDAVIFSKKEYYLAGWCLTQEQYEETWDVVCHMTDEPFNTIREDWLKRLVKYAEENDLVGLFKYDKETN